MFATRYAFPITLISDEEHNCTPSRVNYNEIPCVEQAENYSQDLAKFMENALQLQSQPKNQQETLVTNCRDWQRMTITEFTQLNAQRTSPSGMTVELAQNAIKNSEQFVKSLRLHQIRHMTEDKRVFELQKFVAAHTHRANDPYQAICPLRIGNTIISDVLLDTGAQVNLISMRTLVYGATVDYNWSNALLTGAWHENWTIGGISSAMTVNVLGIVMLPVMSMNAEQKLIMFAVYNDDCRKIILGTEGLKELDFTLNCHSRPEVNMMAPNETTESRSSMRNYIDLISQPLSGDSRNRPIYERLVKDPVPKASKHALLFEKQGFRLTAPDPNRGENASPNAKYRRALAQRDEMDAEREKWKTCLRDGTERVPIEAVIRKRTRDEYRSTEDQFFEHGKAHSRKRQALEPVCMNKKSRKELLTHLRH